MDELKEKLMGVEAENKKMKDDFTNKQKESAK